MSGNKGRDTSSGNEPVSSAIQSCPKPRLELFYSYCDGTGVPNAKYHVYSVDSNNNPDGLYEKKGTLNGQGRARLTDIPDVKQVCYYFEKDPKRYAEFPKIELTTEEKKTKAESLLDAAGAWVWGTLQGDFNKDPSVSQIAVNAIAGLIPLVDQGLDIRDIAAGSKDLIDFYSKSKTEQDKHENVLGLSYETYLWVNLFIIALGCFPVLGSAAKGVLKCMIMWMKRFGKTTGELSPQQLRHIWEMLIATLNNLGVGNAHNKLKDLLTEFPSYMDKASAKLAGALKAFADYVTAIRNVAKKISFGGSEEIIKKADETIEAIGVMLKKLEEQKKLVNAFFDKTLKKFIPHAHSFENLGGGAETLARTQRIFDPDWISEIAKAQGVSKGTVLALMEIADKHGVIIKMRPTNPAAQELLAKGKHLPKPESIKAKTINDLDIMLGAKGQKGEAALFWPTKPSQHEFDTNPGLEARYKERMEECGNHLDVNGDIRPSEDDAFFVDRNGVVRNMDGKAFAGDNDIYEIKKADGKEPFSKEDKALVQADLEKDPVNAQHPAHTDWEPKDEKDKDIKKKIDKEHENDEKLVVYSPNSPPTQKISKE